MVKRVMDPSGRFGQCAAVALPPLALAQAVHRQPAGKLPAAFDGSEHLRVDAVQARLEATVLAEPRELGYR